MIQHGYRKAFPITKSDTQQQPPIEAIYVGGAGDLVVKVDGTTVTFTAPPVGTIIPVKASYVMNATTAINLVGLYGQ